MLKKIISLMLVVCMLFALGVAVSAEGEQVIEVTATAIEDGAFCVDISIKNNILTTYEGSAPTNEDIKGLSAYQVDLTYDSDIFEVYEPYVETAYDGDPTVNGTKAQWSTTYGLRLTEGTGKNRTYNYYKDATLLRYEIDIKSDIPEEKLGTTERISIDSVFSKFANIDGSIINIEPAFVDVVIPDTREPIADLTATAVEGLKYTGTAFEAKDLVTLNTLDGDVVTYKSEPAEIKNAGTYKVTATVKRDGAKATDASADVVIGKADTTITLASDEITYGETEYEKDFTVAEGVDKTEITVTDYTVADLNAGEKEITATATSANYNVTVKPGKLTVNKKAINVTMGNASMTYGDALPEFTSDAPAGVTITPTVAEKPNAGTVEITATAESANYDVTVIPGTLTVAPKAATIKVQNEFQVLGNGKLATFKDPVVEGLVAGDAIDGIVVDFAEATPWDDVEGDYTLTATYTANPNYTVTVVDGVYSVKSAIPVNVTFGENKKTYGDADDAEIVVEGDLELVEIVRVKGLEKAAAGTYTDAYEVTLKAEESPEGLPYALNVTGNTFVIEPKAATITIANAEKKVGAEDPAFAFTTEGFLEGEAPAEIATSRTEGETEGAYEITTNYADPNYTIEVVKGTLTISKYSLTVKAPVVVVYVGKEMPTLEATIEGAAEGDTITANIVVKNSDTDIVDPDTIDTSIEAVYTTEIASTDADTDKYDVTPVPGTITVRKASGRPSGGGTVIKPATGGGSGTTKPEDKEEDKKASANIALKEDAKEIKFIEGFEDKTFRPDTNATRNDVVAALTALFDITDIKNAPTFEDTDDAAIKALAAAGVINGYEDGTFKGYNDVTRAEFVKLVAAALKLEAVEGATADFSDIEGHWAAEWIKTFVGKGYLVGYPDGTFRPDDKITRAEMVVVITRIVGTVDAEAAVNFADLDDAHWAYEYIMKAAK